MVNPYESPQTKFEVPPIARQPRPETSVFLAQFLAIFILTAALWHLSHFVRAFDFLEVPMASLLFPLAAFIDPRDGLVNDRHVFLYGICWWGALLGISLAAQRRGAQPLAIAMTIEGVVALAGIAYSLWVAVMRSGTVVS